MAKAARGRNLFAIDQASIEATLREANAVLIRERDRLLVAFQKIPGALEEVADIETAQAFAEELVTLQNDAKRARLDDGRPFTEAAKTVKSFFDRIEGPLRAIMDELNDRVTQAALRQRRLAAEAAREAARLEALKAAPPQLRLVPEAPAPVAVIKDRAGTPVATIRPEGAPVEIPLQWVVEGFDRETIDLDQLRPYLTDAAILAACQKHLKASGPNALAGAVYGQVATAG